MEIGRHYKSRLPLPLLLPAFWLGAVSSWQKHKLYFAFVESEVTRDIHMNATRIGVGLSDAEFRVGGGGPGAGDGAASVKELTWG